MGKKEKKKKGFFRILGKSLLFIVKVPYYVIRGIYRLAVKIEEKEEETRVKKRRDSIVAKYVDFRVLKKESGDYVKWKKKVFKSESQIGIILGSRGSGKTAFGIKFLENFYSREKKRCYALGFKEEALPGWIRAVKEIEEIENDSFVLIDEGGILFNSRSSMSSANKVLSQLILIARHKNISILFISQNSSNLEVNILRQADFLVLKKSSLLQKDFERKIVQKIYSDSEEGFKEFSEEKGLSYIYSDEFRGFVSNDLPSFWGEKISKGFKG